VNAIQGSFNKWLEEVHLRDVQASIHALIQPSGDLHGIEVAPMLAESSRLKRRHETTF
jgi:hypothetical protein